MNLEQLKESGLIILEYIRGSHLYGTNTSQSDEDIGGIYRVPKDSWIGLYEPQGEVNDETNDITYTELKKYIKLASTANPTVLESLFLPDGYATILLPVAEVLIANRDMFITKRCYESYTGYAYAQIKRAKGKNKKVHDVDDYLNKEGMARLAELKLEGKITGEWIAGRFSKSFARFVSKQLDDVPNDLTLLDSVETDWKGMDVYLEEENIRVMLAPVREQFCHIVKNAWNDRAMEGFMFPFRPQVPEDLTKYDLSSVEHMPNLYRMYRNGKGVFNDGNINFTSIPKEREWNDYVGVLHYNKPEYDKQKKAWDSFWDWMANRNEARWKDNQGDNFEYDHKNMQHTIRLILDAEHIAKEGRPKLRFDGEQLKFLRDVRAGKYDYQYLIDFAENKGDELKELFDKSSLPEKCSTNKANNLYKELATM